MLPNSEQRQHLWFLQCQSLQVPIPGVRSRGGVANLVIPLSPKSFRMCLHLTLGNKYGDMQGT